MQTIIKGKNLEITEALRRYAEEKIHKLEKYLDRMHKAEVEMSVERNPKISNNHCVEVTIFSNGPIIRAKESATDMYQAIDLVNDKLERQVKRLKRKRINRSHQGSNQKGKNFISLEGKEKEEIEEPRIVKTKSFLLKPMTPEEATLQMELLGHDFFVFINAETEQTNVVYRRKDGNYGLIEPGV